MNAEAYRNKLIARRAQKHPDGIPISENEYRVLFPKIVNVLTEYVKNNTHQVTAIVVGGSWGRQDSDIGPVKESDLDLFAYSDSKQFIEEIDAIEYEIHQQLRASDIYISHVSLLPIAFDELQLLAEAKPPNITKLFFQYQKPYIVG